MIGQTLSHYRITGELGRGGMGVVFRAEDTRLDRDVAIKVLPAHLSQDAALRQRLEREARAVSSLNHPHICTLHDIGRADGVDFLVMELLEGETLASRLARGPLPPDTLIKTAIEIAGALAAAHRQGLVHRDLKPGNIMLTASGAKLLDFGLAKSTGQEPGVASLTAAATATSPLTAAGTLVGTFRYMAPGQLEGGEADARSDVFAFGAMLYEMTTGKRAFDGQTQACVIARILESEPAPLGTLTPLAPPALDRLIRTCMAKDPEARRQSMHDLLLDLEWIAKAEPASGRTARTPRLESGGWTRHRRRRAGFPARDGAEPDPDGGACRGPRASADGLLFRRPGPGRLRPGGRRARRERPGLRRQGNVRGRATLRSAAGHVERPAVARHRRGPLPVLVAG
ncbi:MAG: serine/threonine-protein kinase [Acidobacteriota bacterium]